MSISIINRGASGGLKPELIITAPSSTTLDLIRNGEVVESYTMLAVELKHTFKVKKGVYTVRGTLDDKFINEISMVVSDVRQYDAEIVEPNYTMLYDFGDECVDVTGGWKEGYKYINGYITKNTDSITITAVGNSSNGAHISAQTNNKINCDNFVKVLFKLSTTSRHSYVGLGQVDNEPGSVTFWHNESGATPLSTISEFSNKH